MIRVSLAAQLEEVLVHVIKDTKKSQFFTFLYDAEFCMLFFIGSRLNKVYSHSTMNLSSMANDGGTLSTPRHAKSPRQVSPSLHIYCVLYDREHFSDWLLFHHHHEV